MSVPRRDAEDEALPEHQGAVAEREAPDAHQNLHRLDGGDHPARDRPLRGDRHLIRDKLSHRAGLFYAADSLQRNFRLLQQQIKYDQKVPPLVEFRKRYLISSIF